VFLELPGANECKRPMAVLP